MPQFHVFHVETDRSFTCDEYAQLMASVHWREPEDYPAASVAAALHTYDFVGHVRSESGVLVGYLCAFSDGVFATFVGELVVYPTFQGNGVGAALLNAVEAAFPGVPVFVLSYRDTHGFFAAQGYTPPPRPIEVLTKLSTWPALGEITLQSGTG